jgi:hypothetical protein
MTEGFAAARATLSTSVNVTSVMACPLGATRIAPCETALDIGSASNATSAAIRLNNSMNLSVIRTH